MIFGFDEFELDAERLELRRAGKLVKADTLVLRLLAALVRRPGQLVTKDELVEEVWEGRAVADNVITVSMTRLRKTLNDRRGEQESVVTVYGRGYRFVREVRRRTTTTDLPLAEQPLEVGPPFVGRERALARLRKALGETRAGRGQCCVLMGEPGIGKTRAVEALEREFAGLGVRVAWGFCRQAGDTPPLWPWLRLLREVIAASRDTDLERSLGPAAATIDELVRDLDLGGSTPDDTTRTEQIGLIGPARHLGFEAISRAFALAAERSPWVLVLDDLHRADAASLELLTHLLDQIARTRILVIATLRTDLDVPSPRPHLQYVLGHRNCERIGLERLQAEDVSEYVASLLPDVERSLGQAVFTKSEGNPFFMTELCRQLQNMERPDPDALAVPDAALDLIRQRVARLDADARGVLSAAAVIGRSFELPLLAAVTGREPSVLMTHLDAAIAADVVGAASESVTAFAFEHELMRSVLYDGLSAREKRRLHLQIGQALEQRANLGDSIPASELAYHFHAALPEGDLRKTVSFCRAAAAAAAVVFAGPDVVRYTRHALEALELLPKPSVRLRMSLLYMIAIFARGHAFNEFREALSELMRLAHEHADGGMLVRGAILLNQHPGLKPLPGALEAHTRALEVLPPDETSFRSVALAALACAVPACYSKERTSALLAEALPLARKSGSRASVYAALVCQLYTQGGPDHEQQAAAVGEELERRAQQNPYRMAELPVELAVHRAIAALQRGDARSMIATIEAATARSRELRHGELLWHCERFHALSSVNSGDCANGIAALKALHRRAEQRSIMGTEPFCAFDRIVVFGELSEAPTLDDGLRKALAFDPIEPPSMWSLKLRALATAGLATQARATLRAVSPDDLAQLPCDTHYVGTLGHVARAALTLHAREYIEVTYALLSRYPGYFAGHVSFLCEGSVPQLLGMLAEALGRLPQAVAHFEAGIRLNENAGFAPRAAEARLQLAHCLLRQQLGDAGRRALALAHEVHASANRLGMSRLASNASALLGDYRVS